MKKAAPPSAPDPRADLLTCQEVAAILRICANGVRASVRRGKLPRPIYPTPQRPRWRRKDILDWIEEQARKVNAG